MDYDALKLQGSFFHALQLNQQSISVVGSFFLLV